MISKGAQGVYISKESPSVKIFMVFVQQNLKYTHLAPIFWLHNILLVFRIIPHKYKWILCKKKVLNKSFKISDVKKQIIIWFVLKTFNMYLHFKAKKTPYTTNISSFKYVFKVFFWNNQMLKYTLGNCLITNANLERGEIAFEFDAW